MARERLHRRRRDAAPKERGDEVVAKVVQTKGVDAGARARPRERLTKTPFAPRSPLLRPGDESVAIPRACARESRPELWRERDDPLMPRLRGRRLATAHALANDELSAREIDVAPLEPADLPCPEARMRGEQEGEPMARRRHGEDEGWSHTRQWRPSLRARMPSTHASTEPSGERLALRPMRRRSVIVGTPRIRADASMLLHDPVDGVELPGLLIKSRSLRSMAISPRGSKGLSSGRRGTGKGARPRGRIGRRDPFGFQRRVRLLRARRVPSVEQREQDLVTGQPASKRGAYAYVEDVGQRRWIPARASEVREEASCEPDASGRAQLEKELNARADAGDGDREGVVDVERTEDEEAPAPPAADLVRDDLAGLEARDRTERAFAEVTRGPEEKLGARPLVSCQSAELHRRLHRSLPPDGPQGPRTIASGRDPLRASIDRINGIRSACEVIEPVDAAPASASDAGAGA